MPNIAHRLYRPSQTSSNREVCGTPQEGSEAGVRGQGLRARVCEVQDLLGGLQRSVDPGVPSSCGVYEIRDPEYETLQSRIPL